MIVNCTFIYSIIKKDIFSLSSQQAYAIGQRIWQNECNKQIAGLTTWNKGEEFASLGIGHFIWFPRNCSAPYTQTFPSLLNFFKQHNVTMPVWLATPSHCPWNTRDEFLAALDSAPMQELRTLLTTTIDLQVLFMIERTQKVLPILLKNKTVKEKNHIKKQWNAVVQHPNGLYVLIDYINFKGDGTSPKERYNGKGWGLLQILEHMNISDKQDPLESFMQAANTVLRARVQHSPTKETEERFLPGWLNRIKTYGHTLG